MGYPYHLSVVMEYINFDYSNLYCTLLLYNIYNVSKLKTHWILLASSSGTNNSCHFININTVLPQYFFKFSLIFLHSLCFKSSVDRSIVCITNYIFQKTVANSSKTFTLWWWQLPGVTLVYCMEEGKYIVFNKNVFCC